MCTGPSVSECSQCGEGYFLNDGNTCVSACNDGDYGNDSDPVNPVCSECDDICPLCTGPNGNCITCIESYYLESGTCV